MTPRPGCCQDLLSLCPGDLPHSRFGIPGRQGSNYMLPSAHAHQWVEVNHQFDRAAADQSRDERRLPVDGLLTFGLVLAVRDPKYGGDTLNDVLVGHRYIYQGSPRAGRRRLQKRPLALQQPSQPIPVCKGNLRQPCHTYKCMTSFLSPINERGHVHSCGVTGWRRRCDLNARQTNWTALAGRCDRPLCHSSVAPTKGVEPSSSARQADVLAVELRRHDFACPARDSNPQPPVPKAGASSIWATRACAVWNVGESNPARQACKARLCTSTHPREPATGLEPVPLAYEASAPPVVLRWLAVVVHDVLCLCDLHRLVGQFGDQELAPRASCRLLW